MKIKEIKPGLSEAQAIELFDKIEKFAGYSFNLSHATAYSVISYQSMWLKAYHAPQFYAAAMSVLDSERFPSLAKEAAKRGLVLQPPDVNRSSAHFVADGSELVAPFSAIKGVSSNTAHALIEARDKVGGRFTTLADVLSSVERRRCNKTALTRLAQVGAFERLTPLSLEERQAIEKKEPWLFEHEAWSKAEKEAALFSLLPGLSQIKTVSRVLPTDLSFREEWKRSIVEPCMDCHQCSLSGSAHVPPRYGRNAKAVIVTDCPSWGEESSGKMAEGIGSDYLRDALSHNGLSVGDFYFTSLVKSRKGKGKQLTNEQIAQCSRYLDEEIKMLKPGLIIGLGSAALRHMIKGFKATVTPVGEAQYIDKLESVVLVGFNPQLVWMQPQKQQALNEVFAKAASLLNIGAQNEQH